MRNLKQHIGDVKSEIFSREAALDVYRKHLKELEDSRVDCKHEFTKALPNYEHEGGECIHCGINELFAPTLAFLKSKTKITDK